MYKVGEKVVHKIAGLSEIIEIKEIHDEEYYVLNPVHERGTIMVPIKNSQKMTRKPMTKEEIDELKQKIKNIEVGDVKGFKFRIAEYEKELRSGDTLKIATLLKSIYHQKQEFNNLKDADRGIRKRAEELLFSEIGYVLNISNQEAEAYLFEE